ncbi:MAG TPA: PilZ domain-containing protein [Terriglobales bacterium]|nr:PilZ domain-containing protein [Terriglobales bacterium]
MRTVRTIADRHTLTFGVGTEYQLLSIPDLQLNALIDECTEMAIRTVVAKTAPFIRGSATLQDRIPLVTAAKVDTGSVSLNGFTLNLGSGGMAVRLRRDADLPATVRITCSLPGIDSISLDATPRWNSGRTVGLQYASTAPAMLMNWIRNYSARLRVTSVT